MNLLSIEKISKSYRENMLFDQISIGIDEGDKIGVIGVNGTGKSTLLKMIAGLEEADTGSLIRGSQIRISYLAQNPVFDEDKSLLENVIEGKKGREEHWNIEGEAKAMLVKLGIADPTVNPSMLSGGQRKRAALVSTLLMPADILVLDEPTNHLDNEMAQWLEEYLGRIKGALVMVTHDRYFLDKVTNKIWEIDGGNIYSYQDANYTEFLLKKAEREEMESAAERKNKSLFRKDLEWMMRGARARSTKQKAHIARFEALRDRAKKEEEKSTKIAALSARLGRKTVELSHIHKAYGDRKLIVDFSYILLSADRIGIVGKNGCGKSTLLHILTGGILADAGTVEYGQTVKIGYFSQENEALDEKLRVIDYITNVAEYIETEEGSQSASQMLEQFLFTGAMQYAPISKLSGGEKRRLYLLRVLMEAPNILVLDEPTNDLDIKTLSILEDYLDRFPGIVVAVSHDRYFLDRVVRRIFAFEEDGNIRQYEGGFSDYQEAVFLRNGQKTGEQVKETQKEKVDHYKAREEKTRFTYTEQKEYDSIDEVIETLEKRLGELMSMEEEAASNYSLLNDIVKEKQVVSEELEEKMERWIYLNDLAERIQAEKESR